MGSPSRDVTCRSSVDLFSEFFFLGFVGVDGPSVVCCQHFYIRIPGCAYLIRTEWSVPPSSALLCPSPLSDLHHLGGLALPPRCWSLVLNSVDFSDLSPPDPQRGQPGLRAALIPRSLPIRTSFSLLVMTFRTARPPLTS